MFKIEVRLSRAHLSKHKSIRRQEFKQLRIIRDLGFDLKIEISKNYADERVRIVSMPETTKAKEFVVTDPTTIPDEIWNYFGNNYTFVSLNRLKPLLFKTKDGYRIPTVSIKDYVSKPQVRIDHGLIQFDEVNWLEDGCTEVLQDLLDDGWRIIACIPQVAQRRPDYILGRTKRVELERKKQEQESDDDMPF